MTTQAALAGQKRSVLRSLGFSTLSFVYGFYWFYVTRRALDHEVGEARVLKIDPRIQLGALIGSLLIPLVHFITAPVVILVLAYSLLRDINTVRTRVILPALPVELYLFVPVITGFILSLPFGRFGVVIAALAFLGMIVRKLNEYWERREVPEAPYSTGEVVAVAAGTALTLLGLLLFDEFVVDIFGLNPEEDGLQQIEPRDF